jgi:prepilin-type processing-associated H-X9-DG protein
MTLFSITQASMWPIPFTAAMRGWRTWSIRDPRSYIFLDEAPRSIKDPGFAQMGPTVTGSGYRWFHWPPAYHNGGGGFGFADGRAEIKMCANPAALPNGSFPTIHDQTDISWVANRTSAFVRDQP